MRALDLFESDCKKADLLKEEVLLLRKLSRNWGGLLAPERDRLAEAEREMEALLSLTGSFCFRAEVWRLLAEWPSSISGPCRELAMKLADGYRRKAAHKE